MNRLRSATYHAIDGNGNNIDVNGYNMSASYDLNGNIKTMYRKGAVTQDALGFATAFNVIDNMTYTYANNSNTLLDVQESQVNTTQLSYDVHQKGFKGNTPSVTDYTYDDNGNLKSDANKGISNITYNHLNLPSIISFGDGRMITWLYDAAGVKLQKQAYDDTDGTTNTHDYIGGIEYQDNVLEAIYTDEGRAKPNGTSYIYEYTIKDHLGNSRVMFCDIDNDGIVTESEIIQEDHYYPFGLKHEGYGRTITQGENFYQFNGTEKVEDFDLAWHHTLFRSYDPSIGRWHQIDPKNSARESGFVGLGNNPVIYSDMLGDTTAYYNSETGEFFETIYDSRAPSVVYMSSTFLILLHSRGSTSNDGQSKYLTDIEASAKDVDENYKKTGWSTIDDVIDAYPEYIRNYKQCFDAAKAQCKKAGVSPGGSNTAIYALVDNELQTKENKPQLATDVQGVLDLINSQLEGDEPTLTGIHRPSSPYLVGNKNELTQHFIAISGRGIDENGAYFNYYENAHSYNEGDENYQKIYLRSAVGYNLARENVLQITEVRPNQ
jgi:RHS repeat-associated protein